jgi:hypothetical protein
MEYDGGLRVRAGLSKGSPLAQCKRARNGSSDWNLTDGDRMKCAMSCRSGLRAICASGRGLPKDARSGN